MRAVQAKKPLGKSSGVCERFPSTISEFEEVRLEGIGTQIDESDSVCNKVYRRPVIALLEVAGMTRVIEVVEVHAEIWNRLIGRK